MLAPVMLGVRSLREVVPNAIAARGHLIFCRSQYGDFFVDPSDRVVGAWLTWNGHWQRDEIVEAIGLLHQAGRLPDRAVFVDVGANIGTQTVYAMKTGRFHRAVAFEPEPRNAELLEMNVSANALSDTVTVLRKAVGAQAGTATMHLHPRNKGAHSIAGAPSLDGVDAVSVELARFDDAMAGLGVDAAQIGLVWMDVEGAETQALLGLGDYLGKVPLAIEYAPERFESADGKILLKRLQEHYTVMYRLGPETRGREPVSALGSVRSITDILFF